MFRAVSATSDFAVVADLQCKAKQRNKISKIYSSEVSRSVIGSWFSTDDISMIGCKKHAYAAFRCSE
jgi:hypothetical protein